MLSVENPPELPSSGKVVAVVGNERAHPPEGLPILEADPEAGAGKVESSHFSIRDYVFASRKKDVGTNWPFPQQYLQLCQNHGVGDLLPPFQPPHLVRARWRENLESAQVLFSEVEAEREVDLVGNNYVDPVDGDSGAVKLDSGLLTHESTIGSSNQAQNILSQDKSAVAQEATSYDELIHEASEVISKVTRHDQTRIILRSITELPQSVQETTADLSGVEVAKPPPLCEKVESPHKSSEKKCKLIVKLGGTSEHNQSENIGSNSSSVSEPMASKVCPVCKTFSSTSNTTLNAHIDQCLSVESSSKQVVIKFSEHKMKPKKKRSMVDIYATAPCCTLEDLNRRNGTNWSSDLTMVLPINETSCTAESKRPRISTLDLIDNQSEEGVYVDSNGTKLRFLSKFKDASHVDGSNPKKFRKQVYDGKNLSSGKKNRLSAKYKKYLKFQIQSRKVGSMQSKGEIHKLTEGRLHVDTHQEEKKASRTSISQEQIKGREPGNVGRLICSERSGLSKHLNNKVSHIKPRSSSSSFHHTLVKGDHTVTSNSYATRNFRAFATSSDDFSSLKTKSIDTLSNAVFETDGCGKHSAVTPEKYARSVGSHSPTCNGLMLKVPRSSRSCISFPRSKRTDGNVVHRTDELQNSAKETSEISHPPSEKAKRNSRILSIERSSFPIEAIKCTEVVKSVISKRMRRCRHAEKTGKEEKEFPTELSEGCHRSQALNNIGSACNNETNGTRKSNDSSKFWRTENRDNIGQASPSPSNGMDCGEDEVDSHPLDVEECIALKQMQICHTEVAQVGLPVETYNFKSMGKYSPEKAVASHSSGEVTTEDHGAVSCDRLEICPLEDPRESSVEKEATIASSFPRLLGDQGMHCGVIAGDEIISKDIQMVGQLELSVNDDSGLMPQNLQCKTDAVFVQGSSSCLIGLRDTSFELHDDSSVTSGRVATSQDNNIVGNGGPSGSPASSMSTVSHSSMEDLKFKNLELEASEEPVEIQEKMRPNCSNDLPLLHNGSRRGAKRTNPQERIQEVKPNAAAEQTEKRWDGQFHCCSQRGSISQESQLLSQSVTKANHVVSSVYVRPVFSSFHTRSTCISEALPVPILESPTDSISAKASSDSAQKFPTCSNFRLASSSCSTPSQSASSPILRLMGKDLMLTNSGVHHRNLAVHCSSINTSNARYSSLPGFSCRCSVSNQLNVPQSYDFLEGSMLVRWDSSNNQTCVPPTFEPTGCFLGSTLQNGMVAKTNSPFHQKRSNEQWNSSAVCNLEKACLPQQQHNLIYLTQAPIQERERIVIDDSSELDGEVSGSLLSPASILAPTFSGSELGPARTFSYFSSQNPFQSSEMGCGLKSGLPVSCARANSDSTKLGSTSEASGPLLSSPFVAPSSSAGHLAPTICHPTRFR